ncbi:substrate-binding domain-containing protein [Nocardia sp. NBC_01009]|uniref:substrate-binding domain-containing protein n=1 Tax=Nocardia sp. NBC_01009 TaxID=2975996 RepID=UPI0038685F27|nr:substrate-binding domain-containing protein [Nocardia sp. NBC_01009]
MTMISQTIQRRRVLPWLVAGPVLAACSAPGTGGSAQTRTPAAAGTLRSVAVVTQSSPSDAFWSVVKNGALAAGKQLGIRVDYYSAEDPNAQAKLIDNAVAQRVDGLVVSMAYPQPLGPSIRRAVAAGIPVVTTNSGEAESAGLGAIGHVGQSERPAAVAVGKRLRDAGKTKLLLVNHMAGQVSADNLASGAAEGFGNATTTVVVDINNPTDVQSRIKAALQADRSIDAVLSYNAQIAARSVAAAQEANSTAAIATFTLNTEVLDAIRTGKLLFAADPQQYEQGYLPIVLLQLYRSNLDTVGGGLPIQTGPSFVDKSNVDAIAQLVAQGTR